MAGCKFGPFCLGKLAHVVGGALSKAGSEKLEINSLTANDRSVGEGGLFVAIQGNKVDGHDFIDRAFDAGAIAAVVSDASKLGDCPGIVVRDTRVALSKLAALFNGNPSEQMQVVGITGTNGKTTIHWLLYHLFNTLGHPCVRIGTLGLRAESGIDLPGDVTTPDPILIQKTLAQAFSQGATSCAIEVSSHALDQHRADDIQFDVGIFTNLTRDHLDYHGDMDSYFRAKSRLFELISQGDKSTQAAVINADLNYGQKLISKLEKLGLKDYSFGRSEKSKIRICNFSQSASGSELVLSFRDKSYLIRTNFIGAHNAENIAAVFAALLALGYQPERIVDGLQKAPQVPGRLENVGNEKLSIFVDYSHTPDALEHALKCLREISPKKLWTVFGCGGDRDRGKRPQMADIASNLSDRVVVTSDNPRTEDPSRIIEDILSAASGPGIRKKGIVEVDRKLAIEKTVLQAEDGDVILIAGKGHEDYQIIGTIKHPFSDQEEARRVLLKRK